MHRVIKPCLVRNPSRSLYPLQKQRHQESMHFPIFFFPLQDRRNMIWRCALAPSVIFNNLKKIQDQEKLPEPLQFLPPTKRRESEPTIRLTHVETLLLLCHTRWGRDYQRQHGVYEIIRAAHENETVDKVLWRLPPSSPWNSYDPFFSRYRSTSNVWFSCYMAMSRRSPVQMVNLRSSIRCLKPRWASQKAWQPSLRRTMMMILGSRRFKFNRSSNSTFVMQVKRQGIL